MHHHHHHQAFCLNEVEVHPDSRLLSLASHSSTTSLLPSPVMIGFLSSRFCFTPIFPFPPPFTPDYRLCHPLSTLIGFGLGIGLGKREHLCGRGVA